MNLSIIIPVYNVEQYLPQLIRETNGVKALAYGNLTALLVEAIKELNNKLEDHINGKS